MTMVKESSQAGEEGHSEGKASHCKRKPSPRGKTEYLAMVKKHLSCAD